MASVERRTRNGRARWYVRYRDLGGEQRTKTFDRRVDAERYLTTIESSKLTGSYVDPARSRVTVGEWADRWLAGQAHLKPTTRERYAGIVRKLIRPRWGTTRIADVTHADVQGWVTKLSRNAEPATVRKIHRVLSLVLTLELRDGRLTRNPRRRHQAAQTAVARTAVPHPRAGARTGPRRRWPVQPEQAPTPRRAPHDQYRLIVLFLAYTGIRRDVRAARTELPCKPTLSGAVRNSK